MSDIAFDLIKLLDDEPCKVDPNAPLDHLGMEATAKVVAGIVAGTNGPFTIGLYGDWGTGKTTVLHRASQHCDFLENTIVLQPQPLGTRARAERGPEPVARAHLCDRPGERKP